MFHISQSCGISDLDHRLICDGLRSVRRSVLARCAATTALQPDFQCSVLVATSALRRHTNPAPPLMFGREFPSDQKNAVDAGPSDALPPLDVLSRAYKTYWAIQRYQAPYIDLHHLRGLDDLYLMDGGDWLLDVDFIGWRCLRALAKLHFKRHTRYGAHTVVSVTSQGESQSILYTSFDWSYAGSDAAGHHSLRDDRTATRTPSPRDEP